MEILQSYIPEIVSASIGGISISGLIYCIFFIVKKLNEFRTDPSVAALKEECKKLIADNRSIREQNKRLEEILERISDDVHYMYRGE